jgi:hypothetical protein
MAAIGSEVANLHMLYEPESDCNCRGQNEPHHQITVPCETRKPRSLSVHSKAKLFLFRLSLLRLNLTVAYSGAAEPWMNKRYHARENGVNDTASLRTAPSLLCSRVPREHLCGVHGSSGTPKRERERP